MFFVKKILSFLSFICYTLYALSAAVVAGPGIPAPAASAVAIGVVMNALVNRLREFYSTDINDLSRVLHLLVPTP
ncbi:MAG: hypothetical protein LBD60_03810 [Puniceicoccales bacterium]|jgi:hypothetical protein|nr:hypothetical protein [Puniceicoccales bacterium]